MQNLSTGVLLCFRCCSPHSLLERLLLQQDGTLATFVLTDGIAERVCHKECFAPVSNGVGQFDSIGSSQQ